jgi:NADPH:quinone reductase-like Zn-dependent oxidoreductase
MKAVSFYRLLPIEDPQSFVDVSVEAPKPRSRDLLVEVRAVSAATKIYEKVSLLRSGIS